MDKLGDRFINYIKRKYEKKNIQWNRSDDIIWKFWSYVFPFIFLIPILFFGMKFLLIDYLLAKKGFEKAVMYVAIIIVIRPLFLEMITRIVKLKDEIKK